LKRAGIERVDALGRSAQFHSFRKTWQTLGVRYGINQRVAQDVLGHSDANSTAKVYTDVPTLSLHTEIAKLPWIATKVREQAVPELSVGCEMSSGNGGEQGPRSHERGLFRTYPSHLAITQNH